MILEWKENYEELKGLYVSRPKETPMPPPSLDTLINSFPPDARDDLRSIADRMEFQLNNFCQVADKLPLANYCYELRKLLQDILSQGESV